MEVSVFNIIGSILLMLIIISVAATIIIFIGTEAKQEVPAQFQHTMERFVNVFFAKSPYNFCEAISGKEISLSNFHTLLQAVYNGQCGSTRANVTLSFSLAKEDILKIARVGALAKSGKLIYYREASPIGVGGIIIQGQPGYYPLKKWDTVEIWQEGEPQPDTLIKMTIKGCDPYDEICDPLCTYKNLCDPVCDNGQKHDITCNMACIDVNGNKTVDEEDTKKRIEDNKCNPDCYINITNSFKAYDPGCIYKYHVKNAEMYDNICDPNSNGAKDGLCDPDCVKTKNICDPDCDGEVDNGNPNGVKDDKCLVCDEICNAWCSPACEYAVDDPDCERNIDPTFWCEGDQICDGDRKETCENSQDCNKICEDKNFLCCPNDKKSDFAGCTEVKDLIEGDECGCDNQCENDFKCDKTGHCCPKGKEWNGTACELKYTFTLLFIPLNGNVDNLEAKAESAKNFWVAKTPLSKCPDNVRAVVVKEVCNGPSQSGICGSNPDATAIQTWDAVQNCVDKSEYKDVYTKIFAILPGAHMCCMGGGCIGGYTDIYGDISIDPSVGIESTSTHEAGHMFGLCDEGYGGGPCSGCASGYCASNGLECSDGGPCCPNRAEGASIMCSWDKCGRGCSDSDSFNSMSYSHLEKELNKYCE